MGSRMPEAVWTQVCVWILANKKYSRHLRDDVPLPATHINVMPVTRMGYVVGMPWIQGCIVSRVPSVVQKRRTSRTIFFIFAVSGLHVLCDECCSLETGQDQASCYCREKRVCKEGAHQ